MSQVRRVRAVTVLCIFSPWRLLWALIEGGTPLRANETLRVLFQAKASGHALGQSGRRAS
jgi:hypothetical protein